MSTQTTAIMGREPLSSADAGSARWYALYTSSRREKRVADQIEHRGISCFLPLYRSMRRWKDRRKELDLALFPGYVFVEVARQEPLQVRQGSEAVWFVFFDARA